MPMAHDITPTELVEFNVRCPSGMHAADALHTVPESSPRETGS
jgi:hypothetical protein